LTSQDGPFTDITQQTSSTIDNFGLFTQHSELNVGLLNFALINGVQRNIEHSFDTSTRPLQLNLTFPAFTTLAYDPNFGILVNTNPDGSSCGNDGGDGDGSSDTLLV
jgi:hypothetical protein